MTQSAGSAAEIGLDGEDTRVSSTFGTSLEWYRDLWRFPFNLDSAIYVSPDGWDALTLLTTDGRGYVSIYIGKAGEDTSETVFLVYRRVRGDR